MNTKKPILTIDAGNSSIKIGEFINDKLNKVKIFNLDKFKTFNEWLKNKGDHNIIISSVLNK